MRVIYVPGNEKTWAQYYNAQALQHGAGFVGQPYQRGSGLGSLFKGLFRAILPVAKSVGKTVGRQALQTGTEIASDVLAGKNLKESAEERGKIAASKLLNKASRKIAGQQQRQQPLQKRKRQKGRGLGIRDTRKTATTKTPPKSIKGASKRGRKRAKDQLGFYYYQ